MASFMLQITKQKTAFHTHQNGKNEKDRYQGLSRNNSLVMVVVGV